MRVHPSLNIIHASFKAMDSRSSINLIWFKRNHKLDIICIDVITDTMTYQNLSQTNQIYWEKGRPTHRALRNTRRERHRLWFSAFYTHRQCMKHVRILYGRPTMASRTYTRPRPPTCTAVGGAGSGWCLLVLGLGLLRQPARSQSERKRERPCARDRERYIGGFNTEHR